MSNSERLNLLVSAEAGPSVEAFGDSVFSKDFIYIHRLDGDFFLDLSKDWLDSLNEGQIREFQQGIFAYRK